MFFLTYNPLKLQKNFHILNSFSQRIIYGKMAHSVVHNSVSIILRYNYTDAVKVNVANFMKLLHISFSFLHIYQQV